MSIGTEFDRALRLHQQGKLREAFYRYDAILKAQPSHAGALHYSGVVLYQAGKHAEAAERISAALAVEPAQPDAWSNLALVLDAVGRREAAVNALKEATRHAPGSAEIWSNLAGSETALGRWQDAEASARKALAADGHYAPAWYNLGQALAPQGRTLEALDAASRAAGIAPGQAAYAGFKAQIEASIGGLDKAHATLESALSRAPTNAQLRFQLATLLDTRGELAQAADAYEQVTRIDPGHGPALAQLLFVRQRQADWHDLPQLRQRFEAGVAGDALLSPFVLLSNCSSRALQRRCAERWAASIPITAEPPRRLLSGARLRLGYLSADLHTHATAFLAAGLFEAHDRQRFEVVAYSTGPDDGSAMRRRLVRAFDRFVDADGWSAERIAQRIRDDAVDILVDLKGHTERAMPAVLGARPAPIQAHYLGYPGTLGGRLVDYVIGDAIVTPSLHAADYAETLVLLPGSYQVNDRERPIAEAPSREALELPRDAVVLCCFNSTYKLNPEVFDAWARILADVPDAVLWLLVRDHDHPAVGHMRREAVRRGIDARRLVFAAARANPEYLGLYRHADLFLDTWPYNAHTTASDALWAGCPVVTLRGETFAGRVAASLLHAVGLPELVTDSVDAYVDTVTALAKNAGERARLRAYLEGSGRSSALFDTVATTRALEAAYQAMAEQYRRGVREPIRIGTSS
ncbi:MAG TPA: tetratricopeptide repeat protein [Casimicrobiaceae bacterium]